MAAVPALAGQGFSIMFDDSEVDAMMAGLAMAISPVALESFLKNDVLEYFQEDIMERFLNEGDEKVGDWAPLAEATHAIREAQGFTPDDINIRSSEMLDFVGGESRSRRLAQGAFIQVPGPSSGKMAKKIETAQVGSLNKQGFSPTPARPILAADEVDLMAIMMMLHNYIVWYVSSPVGGLQNVS